MTLTFIHKHKKYECKNIKMAVRAGRAQSV
jgi:hypothetical protein